MFNSLLSPETDRPKPYSSLHGILICIGFYIIVKSLHQIPSLALLSPLMLAVILGIGFRNTVGVASIFEPGIKFCLKRLLKFAIILLGVKLSLGEVQAIGIKGLLIVVLSISLTFSFTFWLGKRLGVQKRLALLNYGMNRQGIGTSLNFK